MNTYLTIMVTILVATQLIRITQNGISLYRQERQIKKTVGWLKDNDVSERDFNVQRSCFYMLQVWLERQLDINYGAELEDYEEDQQ